MLIPPITLGRRKVGPLGPGPSLQAALAGTWHAAWPHSVLPMQRCVLNARRCLPVNHKHKGPPSPSPGAAGAPSQAG